MNGNPSVSSKANLIQVKKSNDLAKILRFLACFHEQFAVVKREAYDLLHLRDYVHVAQPVVSATKKDTKKHFRVTLY